MLYPDWAAAAKFLARIGVPLATVVGLTRQVLTHGGAPPISF